MELWAKFFGRACKNYTLEIMALGGMYISGGIVAKVPELVLNPFFEEEFHSSDTHAALLARVPVLLNQEENAGLWGSGALRRPGHCPTAKPLISRAPAARANSPRAKGPGAVRRVYWDYTFSTSKASSKPAVRRKVFPPRSNSMNLKETAPHRM